MKSQLENLNEFQAWAFKTFDKTAYDKAIGDVLEKLATFAEPEALALLDVAKSLLRLRRARRVGNQSIEQDRG